MSPTRGKALAGLGFVLAAVLWVASWPAAASAPAAARDGGPKDVEQQLGDEAFQELKNKVEIIASSPLYDVLTPIANRISQAAQPRYEHPFHFYLVHERQPNAFATPGGNVYVTDALLFFARNTEQLAGTLCHEVSHTIHHDSVELLEKRERILVGELAAGALLGPTVAHAIAIAILGKLQSLGYSRQAESRADVTGSDICAGAGYNPWGLVWLFQDFKNAQKGEIPELLSDHPSDDNRVQTLKKHFSDNPNVFEHFDSNPKSATALTLPKDTCEVFLR